MNQVPDSDAVTRFLEASRASTENALLRDRVLRRTLGVLRRRKLLRRAAVMGAMAACFVAGAFAMWLWQPAIASGARENPAPQARHDQRPVEPQPLENTVRATSALALEWQAFDAQENRASLYRQAGDLYLRDHGDHRSALRCYTQYLDGAGENELASAAEDTWLLATLKESRRKERFHASSSE